MIRGRNRRVAFIRLPPSSATRPGSHPLECQIPFAIASAASCLSRAGRSPSVLDLWARPQDRSRLAVLDHNIVIVTVSPRDREAAFRLTRYLQRLRAGPARSGHFVAMGPSANTDPERLVRPNGPFDAAIFGEPEETVVEVAARLSEDGRDLAGIRGTAYATPAGPVKNEERPFITHLDALPHPAYELLHLESYAKESSFVRIWGRVRWGWMLTSRGCPYRCLFCSPTLRKSLGHAYRAHSPRYVGDLAENLVRIHRSNALAFEDDVFTLSRDRTLAICDELEGRGLGVPWTAQTHLASLDSVVIRRMSEAGCQGICAGVEAGDDAVRGRIKSGSLDRETLLNSVAMLRGSGIALTLYFMIGCPDETLEEMKKTFELAIRLKPMTAQLAFFTVYPGSPAWQRYVNHDGSGSDTSHYDRFDNNLAAAASGEIRRFYFRFYARLYLNPRAIWRYVRHRLPYRVVQDPLRECRLVGRALLMLMTRASQAGVASLGGRCRPAIQDEHPARHTLGRRLATQQAMAQRGVPGSPAAASVSPSR